MKYYLFYCYKSFYVHYMFPLDIEFSVPDHIPIKYVRISIFQALPRHFSDKKI